MLGRRVLALIGAVIAVGAAGGALADVGIAGATSQPVTYYACLSRVGGVLYDVNETSTPTCSGKDLAISWGQVGPAGASGTNGNTIWNGGALPKAGTGANGDFYLDTATHTLFGPKANGQWSSRGTSLVGPAGSSGNTILNGTTPPTAGTGNNGDFYLDTVLNALYGPKTAGAWPPTGTSLIGPAGPSGGGATVATAAPGTNCPAGGLEVTSGGGAVSYVCNGSPGVAGSTGAPGAPGSTGAPGAPGAGATAVPEPAGPNCATGGIKVTDGSGNVTYVCNGAPGPDATPNAIYAWMIQSTQAWVMGVESCWIEYGTLTNCNAGSNGVPADATDLLGGEIASISVSAGGLIVLTPSTSTPGISPTDTYILTPTAAATAPRIAQDIAWTGSGGAVAAGLAPAGYVHPAGSIDNPAADAFPWASDTTQLYVDAIEKCYVETASLTGCRDGQNGVPAAAANLLGGEVASITVSSGGVVTLTTGSEVFGASYTYILTPTANASSPLIPQDISWTVSGTAVAAGLAPFGYVHPSGSIDNPAADAFPWVVQSTQDYVDAVEDCYVGTGSLTNCASGENDIPAAATNLLGGEVASITVSSGGVVTLTTGSEVFGASYTYVLTPTASASSPLIPQDISWTVSGTAVSAGLAPARYAQPAGSIDNPAADAFPWAAGTAQVYVDAVENCYVETGSLTGCGDGQNGVPAEATNLLGGEVASITVSSAGVVTLATGTAVFGASYTYILTPTASASSPLIPQDISWTASGTAVAAGLAPWGYVHPAGSIDSPGADAFGWISEGTQTFETAVENCYVSTGALINCANGENGVPAAYVGSGGLIASITVSSSGVVTLVPAAAQGISASDTYIRTPTAHPPSSGPDLPQDITWTTSGAACADGLVVCG